MNFRWSDRRASSSIENNGGGPDLIASSLTRPLSLCLSDDSGSPNCLAVVLIGATDSLTLRIALAISVGEYGLYLILDICKIYSMRLQVHVNTIEYYDVYS